MNVIKRWFLLLLLLMVTGQVIAQEANSSEVTLRLVADGFGVPTDIQHAGDGRLFVAERSGLIHIIEDREDGTRLPTPFLDITDRVHDNNDEMGLLGLAFHPNYAENGRFFVNYTSNDPMTTHVAQFELSAEPNVADAESELIILQFEQRTADHNGGSMQFGADGMLYISSGDGGNGQAINAQDRSNLLGAILRIDIDGGNGNVPDCDESGSNAYTIPSDNGWADGAGGDCDEIWMMGFRNPWRISFDRVTNALWIADVGGFQREEIDVVPADSPPLNFGWRCYEGTAEFRLDDCADPTAYTPPAFEYGRERGCSITGGYVYRGTQYVAWQGHYIFSDFCEGTIRTLSGNPAVETTLQVNENALSFASTFGEDIDGELYVGSFDSGAIYQIELPSLLPTAVENTTVTITSIEVSASLFFASICLLFTGMYFLFRFLHLYKQKIR